MNKLTISLARIGKMLKPQQWLLLVVLVEWLIMLCSGVGFSGLKGDIFFDLGVDVFQWLFFGLHIPQLILDNYWSAVFIDATIFILMIGLVVKPQRYKQAIALFILLLLYYVTLTACMGHRNFQTGFVLVIFPFLFKDGKGRKMAFQALIYFVGFFYFSAACFKIGGTGFFNLHHMSEVLQRQSLGYNFEKNNEWRTWLINRLVNHPSMAYVALLASVIVEGATSLLFFTRRFNTFIALGLIVFHVFNWILMDISMIGQCSILIFLLISHHLTEE